MKKITLEELDKLSKIDAEVTVSVTIKNVPKLIDDSLGRNR